MASKGKDTGKNTKTNRLFIFLLLCLIVPVLCMAVVLGVLLFTRAEVKKLEQRVDVCEEQVASLSQELLESQSAYESLYEELLEGNLSKNGTDLEEDLDAMEHKVVWETHEQTAKPWDSNSGIRRVYLTFDDGPSANTDKILDILNEYGVKATFFVVGKEDYQEEYQRIVEEGHTLGMHSYSHRYGEIYQSVESYQKDLYKLHDFLYEVTGVDSRLTRFPGGSSNKASRVDMQELIAFLNQENISYFDWNVSSGDASSGYVSAQQIASNVLENVWKYDSVVVLLHDASSKNTTVEALPMIIEKILASKNTVLLPISEDTVPIQHIKAECQ